SRSADSFHEPSPRSARGTAFGPGFASEWSGGPSVIFASPVNPRMYRGDVPSVNVTFFQLSLPQVGAGTTTLSKLLVAVTVAPLGTSRITGRLPRRVHSTCSSSPVL